MTAPPPAGTDQNVRECIRTLRKPPEPGTEKVVEYPDGLALLLKELLARRAWDRRAGSALREETAECYQASFGRRNHRCAKCARPDCDIWNLLRTLPKRR
jgi:hypothetical protein